MFGLDSFSIYEFNPAPPSYRDFHLFIFNLLLIDFLFGRSPVLPSLSSLSLVISSSSSSSTINGSFLLSFSISSNLSFLSYIPYSAPNDPSISFPYLPPLSIILQSLLPTAASELMAAFSPILINAFILSIYYLIPESNFCFWN